MTQASYKQSRRRKLASNPARKARTLAERRADFESQMREFAARDGIVAITELSQVSERIKQIRDQTGLTQYEFAAKIKVAPRTYQSWENGEVETTRENYAKVGKPVGVSANWILFGQEEEPPMPTPAAAEESETVELLLARIDELDSVAESRHSELTAKLSEVSAGLELLRKRGQHPGRGRASDSK